MKIKESDLEVSYTRYIESMGKVLVLFKLKADEKAIGQNYHYFYEDKKKPPLDIAINPKNMMIEYISFFVQDEKIEQNNFKLNFQLINKNIKFDSLNRNKEDYEKRITKNFNINLNNNILYIIDSNDITNLIAYKIDSNNYIFFDKENTFHGLLMRNISNEEIAEMKKSLVL